ncbi:hypothetical protein LA342_00005 [Campylobacter upsaliensis]|uniref:hypothetical protein n=1 Tax=Campylobacter upsaliensis TaxID=28080 RepID=UPI001CE0EA6F|nr:hypothetical protein [Campylobacter upsaliensis]MCA5588197.1 hypothetical protein [Campylobacter upsaliensis]
MTILTCDYNGHKEFIQQTAKRSITPPFAIYAPKTPSKPIKQPLNLFLAKHKNSPISRI